MANWEDILTSAKGLAVNAGRKVTNAADVVALKMELSEKERALDDVMAALGHLLYDSRKDNCDMNQDLVNELIEQADVYYRVINRLQKVIDELCARKTCSCGGVNPESATYCNTCGKRI